MSIFRAAIAENDKSVNVGYLCLFWVLAAVLGILPFLLAAAFLQQWHNAQFIFPFSELKDGLLGVAAMLGASLTALGAYLAGESFKDRAANAAPQP